MKREAVDVDRGELVGRRLKDVAVVVDLPVARPPTGENSSRSTFARAIFQASPVELPDIDIQSL
jgi:hypothetical protein